MTILEATILGIIQGITEFLPISSTGHLILFSNLLGLVDEGSKVFDVAVQGASVFAIFFLFRKRFAGFFDFKGAASSNLSGARAWLLVAVGCFPAALAGFLLHDQVKSLHTPVPVGAALLAGGVIMILVENRHRSKHERQSNLSSITFKQAAIIGAVQVLSLWPGVSRSGSTIIGGLLVGLSRSAAAEFSFLLSAPLLTMAAGYDLYKARHLLSAESIPSFAAGFVVAGIVSAATIAWLMKWVKGNTFVPFGWYRIALGGAVVIASLAGFGK